jgi:basic membrane protein A and related proteins
MNKPLALVALVVLALVAAGCGGSSKSSSGSPETTTTAGGKSLKVGFVPDVSGINDRGFNHLAYQGVQRAKTQLGATVRVLPTTSASDYAPNFAQLAQQGYDLVVGAGYTQISAIASTANKFPKSRFAIVDVDVNTLPGKPKNVVGLLFREQEVGYLAGYLAALEEKRRAGPDVIGAVGGEKQPPIDRFLAGYRAGAQAADPGIKVLIGYAQDPTFADQAKCKEVALNQIAAGSGVEFQVAGGCGLGVISAAGEKNVWAIGVDADQAYIDPQHVLTSATKHVDVAVYDTILAVSKGTYKPGNVVYGLKDNGVGLGRINKRVPQADVAKVDKIRQEIVSGKIANIPTTIK